MGFVTFALIFTSMATLSLSMNRHAREALDKDWQRGQRVLLRLIGFSLLATSLFLSTRDHGSLGFLQWLGMLAAGGFMCIGLLTFLPRRLLAVVLGVTVFSAAVAVIT